MKISKGMYARVKELNDTAIVKVVEIDQFDNDGFKADNNMYYLFSDIIGKPSFDLIELVEYMDLLEIENPVKLYGEDRKISLFNPVRCDGFTEFEDGTHCIILNLDYLVDVKDLKIKSVLTKEQFEAMKYVVERDTNK